MVLFAITTNMLMNAANTNKKNNRRDVSFTFLDRVKEVELNLEDGRWQSALALALTIPDICGGIGFPDMGKRYRDGRVMLDRQKLKRHTYAENDAGNCDASTCIRIKAFSMMKMRAEFDSILE